MDIFEECKTAISDIDQDIISNEESYSNMNNILFIFLKQYYKDGEFIGNEEIFRKDVTMVFTLIHKIFYHESIIDEMKEDIQNGDSKQEDLDNYIDFISNLKYVIDNIFHSDLNDKNNKLFLTCNSCLKYLEERNKEMESLNNSINSLTNSLKKVADVLKITN